MTSNKHPQIVVVGSVNLDLVVRCSALPRPGETIMAKDLSEVCGGKGANQAVAVQRAGGHCTLIGRVGDDGFGQRLVEQLTRENVDCRYVKPTARCSSGVAIVSVDTSGENAITVVPGANGQICTADIEAARAIIESSDLLLVQLEIPLDAVLAAVTIARQAGVRVILDPAPAPAVLPAELYAVDLLCPNESEAASLTGMPVDTDRDVAEAAQALRDRGAQAVVITRGRRGAWLSQGDQAVLVPAFPATVVDTTAAGDAFAGACAVRWAEGHPLDEAVRFANAAGALATMRAGAQPSMALRERIAQLHTS